MPTGLNSAQILGSRLDEVNWQVIRNLCGRFLQGNANQTIVTLNGEIALAAAQNPTLQTAINEAALVIPDSTNILWAGRRAGLKLPEQTAGSDLIFVLAELATLNNQTMFLLGGRGQIPEEAGEVLQKRYPRLKLVGTSPADPNDKEVVEELRRLKPDVLVVAYGAPKQEIWLKNHRDLPCKIMAGLGGTLDMLAGVLPRAPQLFRALHLEWLWRLILQPKRVGRIYKALVIFPLRVLAA